MGKVAGRVNPDQEFRVFTGDDRVVQGYRADLELVEQLLHEVDHVDRTLSQRQVRIGGIKRLRAQARRNLADALRGTTVDDPIPGEMWQARLGLDHKARLNWDAMKEKERDCAQAGGHVMRYFTLVRDQHTRIIVDGCLECGTHFYRAEIDPV